ncbi:anti-sigma factor [Nocardia callitridis]|uniref:Regulator of SigK n=1 Tax=Nocardia callitridis TaxID=648753 RepID=A0ABP9K4B4_9NOCA
MTDIESKDGGLLDLAYPYALDAVTELERRRIEDRVRTADAETGAEFDSTVSRVREAMADLSALDRLAPPARVEAELMAALDRMPAKRQASPQEATRTPHRGGLRSVRRVPRTGWLAAAAAVIVVGVAGGAIIADRTQDQPTRDQVAAQVLEQPDSHTSTAPMTGGGRLVVDSSMELGLAAVRFDAVAPPPSGSSYQLWLVGADGTPRSAGVLARMPSTSAPVSQITAQDTLAVTMEPEQGSPQPTTPIIANVTLS